MFKGINIMIAMNPEYANVISAIEKCAEGMNFKVTVSNRPKDCLDFGNNGKDILVIGNRIEKDGLFLLERWVENVSGPVWVIFPEDDMDEDEEDALILAGAWNVARKIPDPAVIHMTLYRYGKVVQDAKLREEVRKLKKAIMVLALLVASLVGERIIDILPKLISLMGL